MNKHILCIGSSKFQSRMFRPQRSVQPAKTSWWNILVWFVKCASPMLKCFHSWVTEFEPCFYNCM